MSVVISRHRPVHPGWFQRHRRCCAGFTVAELLVVIGVIAVLMAIITPALTGVWKSGQLANGASNLRQIHLWMTAYTADNRDAIVPAYFDYRTSVGIGSTGSIPTKVRRGMPLVGDEYQGTWTDILWTQYASSDVPEISADGNPLQSYQADSPDYHVFENSPDYANPFRSPAQNTRDVPGATDMDEPVPFGGGSAERGLPGYFAANMSFDSSDLVHDGYYAMAEIRAPSRVMYLVDSFYGETIGPRPGGTTTFEQAFWVDGQGLAGTGDPTGEVDFRYGDVCLMLLLDGHTDQQSPWTNLLDLQEGRRIKVTDVTSN